MLLKNCTYRLSSCGEAFLSKLRKKKIEFKKNVWCNLETSLCTGGNRLKKFPWVPVQGEIGGVPLSCVLAPTREGMASCELQQHRTSPSSGNSTAETEMLGTSKMINHTLLKLYRKTVYWGQHIYVKTMCEAFQSGLLFFFLLLPYKTQEKLEKVWKHLYTWLCLSLFFGKSTDFVSTVK